MIARYRTKGKRVREVLHTKEGVRLHVVEYRLPEPQYVGRGCAPRQPAINPLDLLEGLWAAVVESPVFCSVLERISPGLVATIQEEHVLGIGPNAYGAELISAFLMSVQCNGMMGLLIRATEIRDQAAADLFASAWLDGQRAAELRKLSRSIAMPRNKEDDVELSKRMRSIGLTMRAYSTKGVSSAADGASPGRSNLRFIINDTAQPGGCTPCREKRAKQPPPAGGAKGPT